MSNKSGTIHLYWSTLANLKGQIDQILTEQTGLKLDVVALLATLNQGKTLTLFATIRVT